MTGGHPDGLPYLFLDRSLGRHQVPGLLRAAGLRLRTLAEVYCVPHDETVLDVDWLARCGDEGWVVLMKDERIRYRTAEHEVLWSSGVRAFCLASGNLRAVDMAQQFLNVLDEMAALLPAARPGVADGADRRKDRSFGIARSGAGPLRRGDRDGSLIMCVGGARWSLAAEACRRVRPDRAGSGSR
jgi:hypothetical protein